MGCQVLLAVALVVGASLLLGHGISSAKRVRGQPGGLHTNGSPMLSPQQLSPEARALLQASIKAGNFADLRWPNFSDYSAHVQKFYDSLRRGASPGFK